MRNSVVLPVMGVLTVIAGAVGLQLGESAIAQIDPVHFQGDAPVVRDVTQDARAQAAPAFTSAYGWADANQALARDCGDCPALRARDAYAATAVSTDPVIADLYDRPPTYRPPTYRGADDAAPDEPVAERRDVNRYLYFPVNQDQAEAAESLRSDGDRPDPAAAVEPVGL